ncbi:hypothetical protein F4808DRAFT_437230 [Astrocystis sublimbata]|nr:hypothetical protein F4808DRAFT_437230 [Astrocystis sublimbata]
MAAIYTQLVDNEEPVPGHLEISCEYTGLKRALAVFLLLLIFLVGALAGYSTSQMQHRSTCVGTTVRVATGSFIYNQSFAEAPSAETNKLWESIFPPHGGFFHDPVIAPYGASLAVYHQLHCVDAIRQAYYVLFDAVKYGVNVTFSDLNDYETDWHTRHCIDFLRQMLMCNPDLTVEYVNPSLGGITGLDGEHVCIVWEDIVAWSIAQQGQHLMD